MAPKMSNAQESSSGDRKPVTVVMSKDLDSDMMTSETINGVHTPERHTPERHSPERHTPERRNLEMTPNGSPLVPNFFKPMALVEAALSFLLESPPHKAESEVSAPNKSKSENKSNPTPSEANQMSSQVSHASTTSITIFPTVEVCDFVYLLPRTWVEKWLIWAAYYHKQYLQRQHSWDLPGDNDTNKDPLRLVCVLLDFDYDKIAAINTQERAPTLPSPIDARSLGQDDDLFMLKPNVVVGCPSAPSNLLACCAVSDSFYNYVKLVHGVIRFDSQVKYFQAHSIYSSTITSISSGDCVNCLSPQPLTALGHPRVSPTRVVPVSDSCVLYHQAENRSEDKSHYPVEFKRRVLLEFGKTGATKYCVEVYPISFLYKHINDLSQKGQMFFSRDTAMRDAMKALETLIAPKTPSEWKRCWVQYSLPGSTVTRRRDNNTRLDLYGTASEASDGFELWSDIVEAASTSSNLTIGEYLTRYNNMDLSVTASPTLQARFKVIVEIQLATQAPPLAGKARAYHRRPRSMQYIRAPKELAKRIQVGDFVDAQDSSGRWYEAIVREVRPLELKVHFLGWTSRWDGVIPRTATYIKKPAPAPPLNTSWANVLKTDNVISKPPAEKEILIKKVPGPPAPLWTHTNKWRHNLKVGDCVEVRQATSLVQRPKWLTGKALAFRDNPQNSVVVDGGAILESLEDDEVFGGKRPLILLNRTSQVLLEIPEESAKINSKKPDTQLTNQNSKSKQDDANSDTSKVESVVSKATTPEPNPPTVRWVNLYGEEICEMYTHNPRPKIASGETGTQNRINDRPLHAHPHRVVRESLRGTPTALGSVGLHNLGNSCYFNSILQCLNQVKPLVKYFIEGTYMKDINKNNPLGSGGKVATAYARFLSEVWSGDYQLLAPRILRGTLGIFAPQFNNTYQHDSQEFLSFLMDGLHEDCNRITDKPYVEDLEGTGMPDDEIAMEAWRRHLLRHDSIVVDHCQGMHRSHLTCPECKNESVKFDVYSTISLPIPSVLDEKDFSKTAVTLKECLELFTSEEELDESNAWFCGQCKKHVRAKKQISLWSTPDILVLHLKRFQYANHQKIKARILKSKVETPVDYPLADLDMTPYLLGPIDPNTAPIYNLIGVSEHAGRTANSGHYTATARNSHDNLWYKFNDAHIKEASEATVALGDSGMSGCGAYLLFYQRAEGLSRWGGMERVLVSRGADPHGALETDLDGFHQVKSKKKKGKK